MKKINIIIACIALLPIIYGCTNELDLDPKDTLSDASFWKTADDFQKAANTLYSVLPGFAKYDTDADIAFVVPNSISNSTLTTPDTDGTWNGSYTHIRNCNNLIAKATASPIAGEVKVYLAEAKFFRAFNYWQLYRLFGGVPIIDKVLDINSPELYGSRNTAKETIDFIIKDLQEAAPDLPEEDQLAAANKGRITRGAANALLARVSLFEGTWKKFRNDAGANEYLDLAINAANTVINSGKYSLFNTQGAESYRQLFDNAGDNSKESILDRRYESQVNAHNFPMSMQQDGYLPTKKLADMYLCTDGLPINKSALFQGYDKLSSEFENRDPRMAQTIMIPGTVCYATYNAAPIAHWPFNPDRVYTTGYIIYKYVSQNPDYQMVPNHTQQGYDRHIIRYAEVLLVLAEALYEKNGNISDEDLNRTVNLLRERAGLPVKLTNAFASENGLNMREEIRRERSVELALEGFRWDDLRRWKTAETELVQAILGIKIVGTEWAGPILINGVDRNPYRMPDWQGRTDAEGFIISEAVAGRKNFDPDKNYLRPIPAKEIQLNPNLKQNPKW
ncbi:MAG: RagB/SusD family nutrient uptake outer membrane protein [Dysgonamonadaceae bacterium]|jgi:hypothetical protein|nr:RagB/SusD family nutrient uptake outer membrane protein [Dysgonamonadaceae bacterium]